MGTPSESVISIQDNDTAGVTVSPTSLTVTEGDDEEYTVVLDSKPTAGRDRHDWRDFGYRSHPEHIDHSHLHEEQLEYGSDGDGDRRPRH